MDANTGTDSADITMKIFFFSKRVPWGSDDDVDGGPVEKSPLDIGLHCGFVSWGFNLPFLWCS